MYEEMIQFVKATFAQRVELNPKEADARYPFRNRFDHTMRVYQWAMRLQEILGGDREVIAIAAILHDIAKGVPDHAQVGAQMADDYLRRIGYPDVKRCQVVQAIRYHSSKLTASTLNLCIEEKILMDADLLDETGAITIIWDAMATALEENPSYNKVYERIQKYGLKLREEEQYFTTEAGRQFFHERCQVIENFLSEFRFELGK